MSKFFFATVDEILTCDAKDDQLFNIVLKILRMFRSIIRHLVSIHDTLCSLIFWRTLFKSRFLFLRKELSLALPLLQILTLPSDFKFRTCADNISNFRRHYRSLVQWSWLFMADFKLFSNSILLGNTFFSPLLDRKKKCIHCSWAFLKYVYSRQYCSCRQCHSSLLIKCYLKSSAAYFSLPMINAIFS